MARTLVVHYAEIGIKGRNRPIFERRLCAHLGMALRDVGIETSVRRQPGRLTALLPDGADAAVALDRLAKVPGVASVAVGVAVAADVAAMGEAAVAFLQAAPPGSFKLEVRRGDKTFPLDSIAIARAVGAICVERTGRRVDVHRPDVTVHVEVPSKTAYVIGPGRAGPGGLPAGSTGTLLAFLSGGIDSPVAAWMLMRRGSRCDFVHFYSGRSPEEADTGKIEDLARLLARWSPLPLHLYLVPVVPYELRAIGAIEDSHDMVMFRRFMVRTAARLARRHKCLALVTGDSLGQVASQTLHNLAAISPDVSLPILRPLVGLDKHEITAWSRRIGLFDTSIRPYRDCCSIRSPRPTLAARGIDLLRLSEAMGLEDAVREAADAAVRRVIGPDSQPLPA